MLFKNAHGLTKLGNVRSEALEEGAGKLPSNLMMLFLIIRVYSSNVKVEKGKGNEIF